MRTGISWYFLATDEVNDEFMLMLMNVDVDVDAIFWSWGCFVIMRLTNWMSDGERFKLK